jgi:hypothetical protein
MTDRPPSAAASIYPHLKSVERPIQRPSTVSVADAMFPKLAAKPPPPIDPYERYMAALGFIRTNTRQGRGR